MKRGLGIQPRSRAGVQHVQRPGRKGKRQGREGKRRKEKGRAGKGRVGKGREKRCVMLTIWNNVSQKFMSTQNLSI
jgi:hypothetical protein